MPNPDYVIPVEIDGRLVDVYVLKRPWLDHFMRTVAPRFEARFLCFRFVPPCPAAAPLRPLPSGFAFIT